MYLTEQELKVLGRFLESYEEKWTMFAFMAGLTLGEARDTVKKLKAWDDTTAPTASALRLVGII